jgi:hypothetical protein
MCGAGRTKGVVVKPRRDQGRTVSRQIAFLGIVAVMACGEPAPAADRTFYIQRLQRALHPGHPELTPGEVAALSELTDEQIIETLYAQPATRAGVLQLALDVLGAPVDQLRVDGDWAVQPFRYPPAAAAVHAYVTGGDPLAALLDLRTPAPIGPILTASAEDLAITYRDAPPITGTDAERRAGLRAYELAKIAAFRTAIATLPDPIDPTLLCERYLADDISTFAYYIELLVGVPQAIRDRGRIEELADAARTTPFTAMCFAGDGVPMPTAEVLARLDDMAARIAAGFDRLERIIAGWTADPDSVFRPIDVEAEGFVPYPVEGPSFYNNAFYEQFWAFAQNSSTNFNRRRGAYMLERFFCDDLKPVGAALPEVHGAGRHASEPSCAACHFKLDPMAGFFRRYGNFGLEFSDEVLALNEGTIFFDDGALIPFDRYDAAWRATDGSGRAYDVGYIRSTRDPALNAYGSTLDDLGAILRTAPEVQRCLAQRMFEHWNGRDQAVDPGFLDDVTADMRAHPEDQLRRGAIRILAGRTFREEQRNTSICYDLAPGTAAGPRPPCEVASTLRASCTGCHGPGRAEAGLDLASWIRTSDGDFGFRHVVDGAQVTRALTFERMVERLKTSDLARQMPQSQDMPLRAREALVLWLEAQR